jgi:catalase-peroxidase
VVNGYFDNLFGYEWELVKSPAGGLAVDAEGRISAGDRAGCSRSVEDARAHDVHDGPALKVDPIYAKISKRFHENPEEFEEAFAKAWYKLIHRDMGPRLALPRPRGLRNRSCGKTPYPKSIMN